MVVIITGEIRVVDPVVKYASGFRKQQIVVKCEDDHYPIILSEYAINRYNLKTGHCYKNVKLRVSIGSKIYNIDNKAHYTLQMKLMELEFIN